MIAERRDEKDDSKVHRMLCLEMKVKAEEKRRNLVFGVSSIFVPVLASGYVFRCIATFGFIVEDFSCGAAKFSWLDAIEADVEFLAIFWVREMWVGHDLTGFIILALVFGALETILKFFLSFNASLSVCVLGPHAGSRVFIEMKSSSAFVLDVLAINAGVEDFADSGVWVSEEPVLAWAELVLSFWCLQFCAISAVYIKWLVTFVDLSEGWIEDKTIWAESFFGDSVSALIIFVALHFILVRPTFVVRTLEFLGACGGHKHCHQAQKSVHL